jgi:hypothetical protein
MGTPISTQYRNAPYPIEGLTANAEFDLPFVQTNDTGYDNLQEYYYIINATDATAQPTLTIGLLRPDLFNIISTESTTPVSSIDLQWGEGGVFVKRRSGENTIFFYRINPATIPPADIPPATATTIGGVMVPTGGGVHLNKGLITLEKASATQIGGVIIPANDGLSVDANGNLSVAPASPSALGGVKVAANSGITLSNGAISLNAGTGIVVDGTTGAVSIGAATASSLGGVEVPANSGLTNTGGAIAVAPATAAVVGGVKVPANSGLTVDVSGNLSYNGVGTPFYTYKEFITNVGVYSANQVIFNEYQPVAWTLPVNAAGSKFAYVPSSTTTSASTVTIQKNGTAVGAMTFPAGAANTVIAATFVVASAVSFAVGDLLTLVVTTVDSTTGGPFFSNVFGTFVGTHN